MPRDYSGSPVVVSNPSLTSIQRQMTDRNNSRNPKPSFNLRNRGVARFNRTFCIDDKSDVNGSQNQPASPRDDYLTRRHLSMTQGSGHSDLSTSQLRHNTASALHWQLQRQDTHLKSMIRNEQLAQRQLERETRFATIFNEFQSQKQQEREVKERFRSYQK